MAVIFVDGFDVYNGLTTSGTSIGADSRWGFLNGTSGLVIAAGRFGGQAAQSNIYITGYWAAYFTPTDKFVCGHSFYQTTLALPVATINPYMSFYSDLTAMVGLKVNGDGSISACRLTGIASGTILGTSATGVIKPATWHNIEFACTISDTVGTVDIIVEGVNVLSLTNQDTRNGTPTTINRVVLGGSNGNVNTPNRIDDLYITDSLTLLGPMRIETLYPSADTAQKQWTPSTGSANYATIDETLMSSTDFVSANTVGAYDLYDFGNLSSTPSSIAAVTVSALGQKTDAVARAIALPVKSGSTTSDGANNYLGIGYALSTRILNTDPNTSAAWTSSAVNALQAGIKVTI